VLERRAQGLAPAEPHHRHAHRHQHQHHDQHI
jgi:hypothetical protein